MPRPYIRLFAYSLILLLASCGDAPPPREAWIEAASHKNLGLAYLDRNDFESAITAFERVCALVPDDPLGYAGLAVAYLNRQTPEQAKDAINRAIALRENDAALWAILADVYVMQDDLATAVETLGRALERDPANVMARYKYLKLLQRLNGPGQSEEAAIAQLRQITAQTPDNVAAQTELGEALVRAGRAEEAAETYRAIASMLDPLPEDARLFLEAALAALDAGQPNEAARNAAIFGNLLKQDPAYQAARDALGDPSQPSPPLYDFRTAPPDLAKTAADSLIAMTYAEATAAFFETAIPDGTVDDVILTDYDADGRLDLAVVVNETVRLFHHADNGWVDVTRDAGLANVTGARRLVFGDVDNDGDLDAYVIRRGRDAFYRFDQDGFSPVRRTPFSDRSAGGRADAVMADFDHDGDLDILWIDGQTVKLYRNVEDGVFEDATPETGLAALEAAVPARTDDRMPHARPAAAYGDFNRDGALDVFIANRIGPHRLYRNLRQGRMGDRTGRSGLEAVPPAGVALTGDFNNDGLFDLFLADPGDTPCVMLWNRPGGAFDRESTPASLRRICAGLAITGAIALDFDNDGFLDIAVAGADGMSGKGVRLIRNAGNGRFEDASALLPAIPATVNVIAAGDIDGDGGIDLVLGHAAGVTALRNDGGNANRWLDIQLAAALAGSGKNNFYGIGSTIEVHTGTHYQTRLVTSPVTRVGIGAHEGVDVLRVLWSNGVPQNTVHPPSNARVVEQQRLKGSCPSLYTWNGERYVFVTHLMTRSAIGALTDTGEPAFPHSAADYVKIRGDQLREKDGVYTLNVVEELWDAVYFDEMALLVVDHPAASEMFVDEKYTPPPFPGFEVYTATPRRPLRAAHDAHGHDILPHLMARDSLYAGDFELSAYQGLTEPHSITLDLGDLRGAKEVRLFLNGWIMPIEPSSNLALAQHGGRRVIAPYLEVPDARGRWKTVVPYTGFPSGEHKTMVVDLTGKFLADDHRVRITTNLQIYWSEAFYTVDEPEVPVRVTRLTPQTAALRYRGFSREYRETPYGPPLRDYAVVSAAQQWLPFTGYRTRYGDVTPLLQAADDQYVIFASGEEITVTFDASRLPALPEGWTRDFVLYSDGWLKEGDLNTGTAATIEPLPFHGMSRYPYGPDERYPDTPAHRTYQAMYHTRWVSQTAFREQVRQYGDGMARPGGAPTER